MISDEDSNIMDSSMVWPSSIESRIIYPSRGVQGNDLVGFVDAFGQRLFEELDYVPCCRSHHKHVMTPEDLPSDNLNGIYQEKWWFNGI